MDGHKAKTFVYKLSLVCFYRMARQSGMKVVIWDLVFRDHWSRPEKINYFEQKLAKAGIQGSVLDVVYPMEQEDFELCNLHSRSDSENVTLVTFDSNKCKCIECDVYPMILLSTWIIKIYFTA